MRVAVTGALGVIGVWVMRALRARGVEILATGRRESFALGPELDGHIAFRRVDVAERDEVTEALQSFEPDCVIHLAAMLPVEAQADPHRGFAVNVMGTAHVLQAAREQGVGRVVFTSSKAAYGEVTGIHAHPTYRPLREDDAVHPRGVYDVAKVASEGLGDNYQRTGGPEFVSLRFATIFGPGKVGRHGPMAQISGVVEDAVAGRPVRIERGAEQCDDYLFVREAAAGIAAAALHEGPLPHPLYNLGSGTVVSLGEYGAIVSELVPGSDIEIGPGLDPMGFGVSYYSVLDPSRARKDLGFDPPPLRAALADYVELLRAGLE